MYFVSTPALKPKSDAVTQKKQPPETRPKPKISVVVVAQSGNGVKSAGDIAMPSQSVASVLAHRQRCNANDDCTARPTDEFMLMNRLRSSISDPLLAMAAWKESESETLSSCVPKQPVRALAKHVGRDEMSIVHSPVKESLPSRWASMSCLRSDVASCSADDLKEAVKRAKQKVVLQRIVGMNLEGESLPYELAHRPKLHSNIVDINTHGKVNGFPSTRVDVDPLPDIPTSLPAADDMKPLSVFTDAGFHADNESTTAVVTPEPNLLLDSQVNNAVIERSNSSLISETLPTDKTTIKNEESRSTETESASHGNDTHVGEQTRRPISLYPQDMQLSPLETRSRVSVTDASLTTKDIWIAETLPSSLPRLQNDQVSPLTGNAHVTSAKRPQVAASRESYLALREFVSEKFSFLDELDDNEDTQYLSGDADTCGADIEQTVAALASTSSRPTSIDCSTDQASSATTAEHCAQDRSDEKEETAEMSWRNERPKSLLRKSIVLPNGEILDIIGNAFNFLDDYSEQTEALYLDRAE